jgi:hypothetical protein
MTVDRYAPVFNQAVAVNAKSLIVVMVLPRMVRSRLPRGLRYWRVHQSATLLCVSLLPSWPPGCSTP